MSSLFDQMMGYEFSDGEADYHAVATIQLCELINAGFVDWDDPSWRFDSYSEEQYKRFTKKFNDRYYYREISIVPPGLWKQQLLRKLNELMPKYKHLYELSEKNFMQSEDIYNKSRTIYSDFPATMLTDNEDYASSGRDDQYERIREGAPLQRIQEIRDKYDDIDVMLLDELKCMFSSLVALNINGY